MVDRFLKDEGDPRFFLAQRKFTIKRSDSFKSEDESLLIDLQRDSQSNKKKKNSAIFNSLDILQGRVQNDSMFKESSAASSEVKTT